MSDIPPEDTEVPPPGARVAVRNPRGRAAGQGQRTLADLAEQTEVGDVLLRSLTRAQLVLALRIFAVFGGLLVGLPAVFASNPDLGRYLVFGIPLPWVVLGGLIYPVLVVMGLLYVRQAERHEREFTDIVERG
ncbi:MAG: hypothetical protein ACRDZ3_22940 [Acidimicrobiia bacterium]